MGEGRRALGRDRCVLANRVVGRTSARGDENLCAGGRVGQLGQVSGDDLDVYRNLYTVYAAMDRGCYNAATNKKLISVF
jgi:hypothetical protein